MVKTWTAPESDATLAAFVRRKPFAIVDAEGRVHHWSIGCEALYGLAAEQVLGRVKHDVLGSRRPHRTCPAWPPSPVERVRRLVERRGDGRMVEVIETVERLDDRDGSPRYALWMCDIGAAVRSEFAPATEAGPPPAPAGEDVIGTFEIDVPSERVSWHRATWETIGFQSGSIALVDLTAFIDPLQIDLMTAEVKTAGALRQDTVTLRASIDLPGAGTRLIEAPTRLVRDAQGILCRLTGVLRDATQWQARESALLAWRAELRAILDAVPDAMIVADGGGRIRSFSRTAETLFGYSAAAARMLTIADLLPDGWRAALDRVRTDGSSVVEALRADGDRLTVELRVGDVPPSADRMMVLFFRDVSPSMPAAAPADTMRASFAHQASASLVNEFAAHLTHEISQPLGAIVNFAAAAEQMLEAQARPREIAEVLERTSGQAMRALAIIRRLFAFTMRRETDPRTVSVEATLRDGEKLAVVSLDRPAARAAYDLDPAAPTMIVDRVQIQQVLVNLLHNSAQAMRYADTAAPRIAIASRKLGNGMIEIAVADNGPGIETGTIKRMFQPFVTTKSEQGMGLGLSICRSIVEAHGGTIAASNLPGGGARVCFTVPAG